MCIDYNDKVIVISVSAHWCMPCRMQKPAIRELEKEYEGRVAFFEINADDNSKLCGELHVSALPTTIIKNGGGQLTTALVGVSSKSRIKDKIEELLK